MDIVKFAQFVKIAEAGSISRAASSLCIAQPALSRMVKQLEDELECRLFERDGRGVEITAAGRRLYSHAKAILDQIETAELAAGGGSGPPLSSVTLGIAPMLAAALAPQLAFLFRSRYPRVLLRVAELRDAHLFQALKSGLADVVIGPRHAADDSADIHAIGCDSLHYVVRSDRWAGPRQFDFEAARSIPLVLAPQPDAVRRSFVAAAQSRSIALSVLCETDSLTCYHDLVASGLCSAIIPTVALPVFSNVDLVTPDLDDLGMTYEIVVGAPMTRPSSTSARRLLDLVIEELLREGGLLGASAKTAPALA